MSISIIPQSYSAFLASKRRIVPARGPVVDPDDLPDFLFPFQRAIVSWAIRKGRAALFADTGMGKTAMQLTWAQHIADRTLILAPLAVARQTVGEGERFGIPVTYARSQADAPLTGITITNYEMLDKFDAAAFDAVVLDESSILANFTGKTEKALVESFKHTPYRLCCTATPAPNDTVELTNHADFLGLMTPAEMISTFFTPKGSNGQGGSLQADHAFRLKGHAHKAFFHWLASWAMAVKHPSDIGFDDVGYDLPPLDIRSVTVPSAYVPQGQLLFTKLKGVQDRAAARRSTIAARVAATAELVNREPNESWLIWCGLNDEGRDVAKLIPGAVVLEGNQSPDEKADVLMRFASGDIRVLVTKTSIAGFGLNFQICARMAFLGINDSYQSYYQAIRRSWRFGQTRPVVVYVVTADVEVDIYNNILRKEADAKMLSGELIRNVADWERLELHGENDKPDPYNPVSPIALPSWLRTDADLKGRVA